MAYTPANLARISGNLDGSVPGAVWFYSTSDSDATAKASGYFSDAYNKGVRVGDIVYVNVVGTGLYIHSVLTCTSAPACTVTQTPATST